MRKTISIIFGALAVLFVCSPAWGQGWGLSLRASGDLTDPSYAVLPAPAPELDLVRPVALPRMSPELALDTYLRQSERQATALAAYSASTTIRAELPDSRQQGEYELRRQYTAPDKLKFTPVRFSGDGFVKSNVIVRLLQSEADHVQKQRGSQTAVNEANYKFSYKGVEDYEGVPLHVFQVKPRKKRPGLFKGRVYLDVASGHMRRVEGQLVKTPSWFVKKVEFVQDFADFGEFTFPVHVHSVAKTRLVGRAVVDVVLRDYQPTPAPAVAERVAVGGSK